MNTKQAVGSAAMSACTPASVPIGSFVGSLCTPPTGTTQGLALAPLCDFGDPQDPASLLETAAVQVASQEARRVFGWPRLRSFQRQAVAAWASGKDSFLLSGTGSGKTVLSFVS